ncbi:hypothetical protein F4677DRAFT_34840 [Hypoxylon crocopeplum]|nr:hypothetical protein F4677DRAFT_34840 [Hypoxylon crocopeplum]
MPILLFCTALEAKSIMPKLLAVEASKNIDLFALAGSREVQKEEDLKTELKEGELFETDFIGASEGDCQAWALEQMGRFNSLDKQLIAIADKRSAQDQTIVMQFYNEEPGLEFPGHGTLPPEQGKWYSFRIKYEDTFTLDSALSYGAFDVVYPTYFGRKDLLTDDQGIFDVQKAQRMSIGKETDVEGETAQ